MSDDIWLTAHTIVRDSNILGQLRVVSNDAHPPSIILPKYPGAITRLDKRGNIIKAPLAFDVTPPAPHIKPEITEPTNLAVTRVQPWWRRIFK